jgi:hypothetical protein
MKLLIILVVLLAIFLYKKSKSNLENSYCPVIKNKINFDVIGDIDIKPIGCYINIIDAVFTSCVNPYSKETNPDNGITLSKYPDDTLNIIKKIINNGYDLYGNKILNKYRGTDYSQLSIIELATLGYLSGYKFMSITSEKQLQVFFSYSQPLKDNYGTKAKPDLPFTLMPKNGYTDEIENAPGKELSCGFPCMQNGKPQTSSSGEVYMCGSLLHPTIKTTPRYSVYEIYEKN